MTTYSAAATVVDRLSDLDAGAVLRWASPVPYFGDLTNAQVATVGINPSPREFVDERGVELEGSARRLPTLRSLRLEDWSDANSTHLRTILEACDDYFNGRPYDRWFRVLDMVLAELDSSYYGAHASACHLDLVPYTTTARWGSLAIDERRCLLRVGHSVAGVFVRDSPIRILILNGRSVVEEFVHVSGIALRSAVMPGWSLPRASGQPVPGLAYWGAAARIGSTDLGRQVMVLGYNHNLQSSFGVTAGVQRQIAEWIGHRAAIGLP